MNLQKYCSYLVFLIIYGKGGGGLSCTNLRFVLDFGTSYDIFASIDVISEVFRVVIQIAELFFLSHPRFLLLYVHVPILLILLKTSDLSFETLNSIDLVLHTLFQFLKKRLCKFQCFWY